jgi:Flp pilus assembly protein TadB
MESAVRSVGAAGIKARRTSRRRQRLARMLGPKRMHEAKQYGAVHSKRRSGVRALRDLPSNMLRTVQGIAYDGSHWSVLPPQRAALGASDTTAYVVSRDDRPLYLLLVMCVVVLLVAMVMAMQAYRMRRVHGNLAEHIAKHGRADRKSMPHWQHETAPTWTRRSARPL